MTTKPAQPSQFRELWEGTIVSQEWTPTFLRCGSYDEDLKAFQVKTDDDRHFLWIPYDCKFGLRFMNHVIYCVWSASRLPAFPESMCYLLARTGKYTDLQLRSGFFDEVIEYWYPAGTQLPTPENLRPTVRSQPLHSTYLTTFLVMMYHHNSPTPVLNMDAVWKRAMLGCMNFDWEVWAQRKPTNQILLGTLTNPSVEIDLDSWSRYSSAVYEEFLIWSAAPENQPGHENQYWNPPVQRSNPKALPETTRSLECLDASADETSGTSPVESNSYTLQLNRTHLLFVPPLDPARYTGAVAQVCIRGDPEDRDMAEIFAVEQASVTRTIETLLVGHVNASYNLPKCVIIKEVAPGYSLVGVRKHWKYGRGKKFSLGDTTLQPAEDKWVFHFEKAK